MGNIDSVRRAAIAAFFCVAFAPAMAFAQDPRAASVQKTARDWLALADSLNAEATWKSAGARFQQKLTTGTWADELRKHRASRGAVVQRAMVSTVFASSFPGLPADGTYALVRFRTSFANHPNGSEDVTLEMGPDSVWRVIGYLIR